MRSYAASGGFRGSVEDPLGAHRVGEAGGALHAVGDRAQERVGLEHLEVVESKARLRAGRSHTLVLL